MSEIKLEVGKTYRSREGKEVEIVDFREGIPYPYKGSKGVWYRADGGWASRESPQDLIAEVPSETTHHTFMIPDGMKEIIVSQEDNRIVVQMVPKTKASKPEMLKEGDIVFEDGRIMIVKMYPNLYHAMLHPNCSKLFINEQYGIPFTSAAFRLATVEETQLLFDALKKAGKRWNPETMQVEEISEFDRILEWVEMNIKDGYYKQEDIVEAIVDYLEHKESEQFYKKPTL